MTQDPNNIIFWNTVKILMVLAVAFLAVKDTTFFTRYSFYNAKQRLLVYPFILIFCGVLSITSFVCAIRIWLTLFWSSTSPYRKICKLDTNLGSRCSIMRLLTCVDLIVVYCVMPAGLFLLMYHVYWIIITVIMYPFQVGTYVLLIVMIALFAALLVYCFLMVAYMAYLVCRDAIWYVKNYMKKNTLVEKKASVSKMDEVSLQLQDVALDVGVASKNDDIRIFKLAISRSDLELYISFVLLLMWLSGFLAIYYVLFVANALNPNPPSEFIVSVVLPSAAIPLVTFWFTKEKGSSDSQKEKEKKTSLENLPERSNERERINSLSRNKRNVENELVRSTHSKDKSKKNDSLQTNTP